MRRSARWLLIRLGEPARDALEAEPAPMRTYEAGHTLVATANGDALTWITEPWRISGP